MAGKKVQGSGVGSKSKPAEAAPPMQAEEDSEGVSGQSDEFAQQSSGSQSGGSDAEGPSGSGSGDEQQGSSSGEGEDGDSDPDDIMGDEFDVEGEVGGSGRDDEEGEDILGEESSDLGDDGDEEDLGIGGSDSEGGSDDGDDGERGGGGSDDDADADVESDGEGGGKRRKNFLDGEKGASFAKAFSKLVRQRGELKEQLGEGSAAAVEESEVVTVPILSKSKSLAKRQAEEEQEGAVDRAAKKLRLQMRQRGHVKVPRKGENPAADLREKQLVSLATKGVVLLFNAVAKAQKQTQDSAALGGGKPTKLSKASFLAQLKGAAEKGKSAGAGSVLGLGGKGAAAQQDAPGWKVLQQDFTGLPGASKMKDWDKEADDSDGPAAEKITVNSDDDDENGW